MEANISNKKKNHTQIERARKFVVVYPIIGICRVWGLVGIVIVVVVVWTNVIERPFRSLEQILHTRTHTQMSLIEQILQTIHTRNNQSHNRILKSVQFLK